MTETPTFQLSDEQKHAIKAACLAAKLREAWIGFLSGNAGTGKSVIVREVQKHVKCVILAPTGLAALNVGGQTIHSFCKLPTGVLTSRDLPSGKDLEEIADVLKIIDLVIVDEISMVRADLLDAMDKTFQKALNCSLPFGGKPILFVGDMFQLEPVVGKDDVEDFKKAYQIPFWFGAKLFQGLMPPEVTEFMLTEVFRQDNPDFLNALNKIRVGDPMGLDYINQFMGEMTEGASCLTLTNERAERINKAELAKLEDDGRTYYGKREGTFQDSQRWRDRDLPTPGKVEFKIGARVIVTANDADAGLVNGMQGTVTDLGTGWVRVYMDSGYETTILPKKWKQEEYTSPPEADEIRTRREEITERLKGLASDHPEVSGLMDESRDLGERLKSLAPVREEVGSYRQIPLRLGYAITVHKAQGMTLSRVHATMEKAAWAHGQVYVLLSRVRTPEGLTLAKKIGPESLHVHPLVAARYKPRRRARAA